MDVVCYQHSKKQRGADPHHAPIAIALDIDLLVLDQPLSHFNCKSVGVHQDTRFRDALPSHRQVVLGVCKLLAREFQDVIVTIKPW